MIDKIDGLLVHWGEQYRWSGVCRLRSVRCALNTDGQPRGNAVSQGLAIIYDVALDELAEQVDEALSLIAKPVTKGGLGERAGEELKRLARVRYLTDPMPSVNQQMRRVGYKSEKTYRVKLHQLHCFVESFMDRACICRA